MNIRGQRFYIRGQRLYEGNGYTRATVIRGQRLYEGNGYTRATAIRWNEFYGLFQAPPVVFTALDPGIRTPLRRGVLIPATLLFPDFFNFFHCGLRPWRRERPSERRHV